VNRRIRPPRPLTVGAALLLAAVASVVASCALPSATSVAPGSSDPPATIAGASASPVASLSSASTAPASVGPSFASGFAPIDLTVFARPQWLSPSEAPGDSIFRNDPGRPVPSQSASWVALKAAGRIALVDGQLVVLDEAVDPLTDPKTGAPVPQARRLDLDWARWIVEPYGDGTDVKGNSYTNRSYWNLCGPGAVTVALYYWQQLTGHPDVTGTAGYFLDPYEAAGAAWPSRGPVFFTPDGKPQSLGTYWTGSDSINGFTAHARGFLMHLAMDVRPAGWTSTGIDIFVDGNGTARYPTLGAPPSYMMAALNWEASSHHLTAWADGFYAQVSRWSPTLGRDLRTAAMLDIGRDGIAIVASADTYYLPNWLAANPDDTPHTRHAIAIVGYDNTSDPPTYTYLDTCGRRCNSRGGNRSGQVHVISQDRLEEAVTASYGMGFIW
jgi:hypothetical protein